MLFLQPMVDAIGQTGLLSLFFLTFGLVLSAELVGDKAVYTISALATRYRRIPILFGVTTAFMAKMLVAVFVGGLISKLPPLLLHIVSAATFFSMALALCFGNRDEKEVNGSEGANWRKAALVSFGGIFLTERGDPGQIAAATLAALYHARGIVWLGASLALTTKGVFAITLGASLRRRISRPFLRYGAIGLCLTMAILFAIER